jgi:NOL1/NOP2/fmu family ribosome biogenesis protein
MRNLKILNNKEIKHILSLIKQQWNSDVKLDYGFLMNRENKIFLINRDIAKVDITKLRINSLGLYLGEIAHNELRLSIEGSQLIGPYSKKNIIELSDKEAREWLKGFDLEKESDCRGHVILKNNKDYLGTGRIKANRILNFIPKNRRLKVSD